MPPKSVFDIARRFVVQYYKIMSQNPEELHKFYKDQSDFVHPPLNNTLEDVNVHGDQAIREYIHSLQLGGTGFDLDGGHLDAQPSENDCVLLVVTGHMSAPNSSIMQPFVQTFLLAPQPVQEEKKASYFVRNSIFRLIGSPVTSSVVSQVTAATSPTEHTAGISKDIENVPAVTANSVHRSHPEAEPIKASSHAEPALPAPVPAPAAPAPAPVPASAPVVVQKAEPAKETPPPDEGVKTYASLFRKTADNSSTGVPAAPPKARPTKPATSSADHSDAKVKKGDAPRSDSKPPSNPSIYVNHLDQNATKEDLHSLFEKYGKIERIDLHEARSYAFIEFSTTEAVKKAIAAFQANESAFTIKGKAIGVEERQGAKKDKASGDKPRGGSSSGTGDKPKASGSNGDKGPPKGQSKPRVDGKPGTAK